MVKVRQTFLKKFFVVSFVAFLGLGFAGCAGVGEDVSYLVILGDSLAVGTQPDANGDNMTTDRGYGETLYQLMLPLFPNLQLVKLGCLHDPGETTVTMANGGSCDYPEGSQLDAAKEFLLEHGENTVLVTIDIGVNDLLQSGCIDQGPPLDVDPACVEDFLMNVLPGRLSFIMGDLFTIQAEKGFPIFGLNYYNPFVVIYFAVYPEVAQGIADAILADPAIIDPITSACVDGCSMTGACTPQPACIPACVEECVTETVGGIVAEEAPQQTVDIVIDLGIDTLSQAFNFQVLQGVYDVYGFPVADMYTSFMAGDFTLVPAPPEFSPIEMAPVNALSACLLTYMCPDPMSGLLPNIHATDAGYQLMGQTVFQLFNTVFPP
jgi:lysophospholipase L1-like esterase